MRLCEEGGCDRPHMARGLCSTHYGHARKAGTLDRHPRAQHPPARHYTSGYNEVHNRVKRDRGPASAYPCVDCGSPGRDWSYNYTGGHREQHSSGQGPWSPAPADYSVRCRSCHRTFDEAHRPVYRPNFRQWSGEVADYLATHPTGSARTIGYALGRPHSSMSQAIRHLVDTGRVVVIEPATPHRPGRYAVLPEPRAAGDERRCVT